MHDIYSINYRPNNGIIADNNIKPKLLSLTEAQHLHTPIQWVMVCTFKVCFRSVDKHKEEEEALPAVVELLHLGTATQCRSMSPRVWTYFTVSETKSEPVLRCAYTKCYELLFKKQKCVKNPFCASQKYSFCTTAFFRPI